MEHSWHRETGATHWLGGAPQPQEPRRASPAVACPRGSRDTPILDPFRYSSLYFSRSQEWQGHYPSPSRLESILINEGRGLESILINDVVGYTQTEFRRPYRCQLQPRSLSA